MDIRVVSRWNRGFPAKIKIGKQNPRYYQVTEGLQPGEKIITSGYEMFGDNERLIFK